MMTSSDRHESSVNNRPNNEHLNFSITSILNQEQRDKLKEKEQKLNNLDDIPEETDDEEDDDDIKGYRYFDI